ncbi:MAG: methyltransferase domain-containing protein [Rhodospirillales bacterium]
MLARLFGQFLKRRRERRGASVLPGAGDPKALILAGQLAEREGRFEDAVRSYEAALPEFPDSSGLHLVYGQVLHALGRDADAVIAYRKGIALKPGNAGAENNLGIALCAVGNDKEAVVQFRQSIADDASHHAAYENLGGVLYGWGQHEEALECFRQVIARQPDNGNAQHMIAALTGLQSERAPDDYVAKVFDGYAGKFDAHLVQGLEYHVPQQLVALIVECPEAPGGKWDVLDLGCGTGLVGVELKQRARSMTGVDLSRKMLDKAREKNVYTRLEQLDLVAMMKPEAAAGYDLVTSTDVFIYIGKIDDIVAEGLRLLRPGGLFAFSVEAIDPDRGGQANPAEIQDYRLAPNGRYAQSSGYLARLAADYGFKVLRFVPAAIRRENNKPVAGWLVVWQKPASVKYAA